MRPRLLLALTVFASFLTVTPSRAAAPADSTASTIQHVILISVDGLRPDAVQAHDAGDLPHFHRLRTESAFTENARSDANFTNTLPNHIAQLTGRFVLGEGGHGWVENGTPDKHATLHANKGDYVYSVFDNVHDAGGRTGAYVSKKKFALLDYTYGPHTGAPDVEGEDFGKDKIDAFVYDRDTGDLVQRFADDMRAAPHTFALLHLRNPDTNGHIWGWRLRHGSAYMRSVRAVDALLGQVFALVDQNPQLSGKTAIILTADHGGDGRSHGDHDEAEHYTIPFYVWGPGIDAADLYALNPQLGDPGTAQPAAHAPLQPVRNGSAANLALSLLGLPPVPGSTINSDGALRVRSSARPEAIAGPASSKSNEGLE